MQPVVTIAISNYNHAHYISLQIESALAQTGVEIELLVYDDGSSDESISVIQALADKYGFFFQAQQNKGLAATLNDALARAKGRYFCAPGSDDILFLDKTKKQHDFMEANPDVVVCAGNVLLIDSDGLLINKRQKFHPARDLNFDQMFENSSPGFVSPSAMIRTDVLRAEGGFCEDIPLEDLSLWLKLSRAGHRFHVLNDALYYYRKHPDNTYRNLSFMRKCIVDSLAVHADHPKHSDVLYSKLNSLFLTAAKQGDRALAKDILKDIPRNWYNRKTIRGMLYLLKR